MKVGTRKEKRMEITLHGVGRRKEEDKGAKGTKEENEEEIIHECGRRKERRQDRCKEKRRNEKDRQP